MSNVATHGRALSEEYKAAVRLGLISEDQVRGNQPGVSSDRRLASLRPDEAIKKWPVLDAHGARCVAFWTVRRIEDRPCVRNSP